MSSCCVRGQHGFQRRGCGSFATMLRAGTPPRARPDAFCPSSPPVKSGKHDLDDLCSTAAPSPAFTDLSSPWGTPFHGTSSPCPHLGNMSPWAPRDCPKPRNTFVAPSVTDMSAPWAMPTPELNGLYGGFNCSPLLAGTNVLELAAHDIQVLGAPPPVCEAASGLADALESASSATINTEAHKPTTVEFPLLEEDASCTVVTPPATPRKAGTRRSESPPGAPRENPLPPLLGALCVDSLEKVSEILEADPEAAAMPFWEHDVSPPLCSAVRHGCDASIVQLLMEKRADPDMPNSRGQTPLSILASTPSTGTGHNGELWAQGPPQRPGNGPLPDRKSVV